MEGMDDTTSLKDSTEIDENDDAKISVDKNVVVKNGFDKNDGTTPAVDPESHAEPDDGAKMQDFDPKVEELLEPAKFAPKDLLALLRNIEAEIHQVGIKDGQTRINFLQTRKYGQLLLENIYVHLNTDNYLWKIYTYI